MFLVCGEALFDLFVDPTHSQPPNKVGFSAIAGGSPFNVAVGLSRLGICSGLLTGLTNDFLGQQLHRVLEKEGVSTRYLSSIPHASTTLSLVAVDDQGVPHYSFYGHNGADRLLESTEIDFNDLQGLHLGSYSLVVEPTASTLLKLVQAAPNDLLITLDPNVRLNVEPDLDIWKHRIAEFASHAHAIKVSEEDLGLLYPEKSAEEAAAGLLSEQTRLVFLTQGERGACVYSHQGRWHRPAPARTQVIDTVGAGDTFQAALITYLLEQALTLPQQLDALSPTQLHALLDFASGAAALTCQRHGPDLPRRHELKITESLIPAS